MNRGQLSRGGHQEHTILAKIASSSNAYQVGGSVDRSRRHSTARLNNVIFSSQNYGVFKDESWSCRRCQSCSRFVSPAETRLVTATRMHSHLQDGCRNIPLPQLQSIAASSCLEDRQQATTTQKCQTARPSDERRSEARLWRYTHASTACGL